ncbi:MAG: hypothetical protein ACYTF3_12595, partial [Planctomycetota bacterium]
MAHDPRKTAPDLSGAVLSFDAKNAVSGAEVRPRRVSVLAWTSPGRDALDSGGDAISTNPKRRGGAGLSRESQDFFVAG